MKLNELNNQRIQELKAQQVAQGAKVAGKKAVGAVKKVAGAVAGGARKVADKGMDKAAGALANQAKAMGATRGDVAGAQQELSKQGGLAGKVANSKLGKNMAGRVAKKLPADADPKAKQVALQKAQRAAQGSRLAGGKSAAKFQQGVDAIGKGKAVTGMVSKEMAPHIKNLQAVLGDPTLRMKWMQLVKQAKK